eukprot:SAG11_NODE_20495_length_444_cov_0.747826_1_plen_38_part_10
MAFGVGASVCTSLVLVLVSFSSLFEVAIADSGVGASGA